MGGDEGMEIGGQVGGDGGGGGGGGGGGTEGWRWWVETGGKWVDINGASGWRCGGGDMRTGG